MYIYTYLIDSNNDIPDELKNMNMCFLDIETTGFSREKNIIYLIGLLYYSNKNSNWYIKQFFANELDEEEKLLRELSEFIDGFEHIVTFNGERFDIPFILHRLNIYNLNANIDNIHSFDLYKEIKKYSYLLNLKNYKLKTVEEYLGIYREDKYSGKDCIQFYYQYINMKDNNSLDIILKHNYDDLYYLIDIFKIFDIIRDLRTINIEINDEIESLRIDRIDVDKDLFSIICKSSNSMNMAYFTEEFSFKWEENNVYIGFENHRGLITPTKECLFTDVSLWPLEMKSENTSEYFTPKGIVLLKVENKFQMDNIKNIIREIVLFVQSK